MIKTHAYDIARDENAMNYNVYIRVRSKAATTGAQLRGEGASPAHQKKCPDFG